jgi:GntR family transcriptional regulator of abcA and norABC
MLDLKRGEYHHLYMETQLLENIKLDPNGCESFFYYSEKDGNPLLKTKLRELYCNASSTNSDLFITYGCLAALRVVLQTFPGHKRFYVYEPTYKDALAMLKQGKRGVSIIPTMPNGSIDKRLLEQQLDPETFYGFFVMSHLNNPDGKSLSTDDKKYLANLAQRNNILIIEDDVFKELYFDERETLSIYDYASFTSHDHNVFRIAGLSKILLPGLSLGFIESNRRNINHIKETILENGVSPVLSYLAILILEKEEILTASKRAFLDSIKETHDLLFNGLISCQGVEVQKSQGGYFLWLKLPGHVNTTTSLMLATDKFHLSYSPGVHYFVNSQENFLRINFAALTSAEAHLALEALQLFLEEISV